MFKRTRTMIARSDSDSQDLAEELSPTEQLIKKIESFKKADPDTAQANNSFFLDLRTGENKIYLVDDALESVLEAIEKNKNIMIINASGINIQLEGMRRLYDIFHYTEHLGWLEMPWNNVLYHSQVGLQKFRDQIVEDNEEFNKNIPKDKDRYICFAFNVVKESRKNPKSDLARLSVDILKHLRPFVVSKYHKTLKLTG